MAPVRTDVCPAGMVTSWSYVLTYVPGTLRVPMAALISIKSSYIPVCGRHRPRAGVWVYHMGLAQHTIRTAIMQANMTSDGKARARNGSPDRPAVKPAVPPPDRIRYVACGWRQGLFAFALLIELPFLAGVLHMLLRRIVDGVLIDVPGLLVIAVGLAAVAAMLTLELIFSVRARVKFGRAAVSFTLPRNGGPVPLLRYTRMDIPYHAIKNVELRSEVFGGKLAPAVLRGLVVRTKDNREVVLGHTRDGFDDPSFPFAEIGHRIAQRAALQLLDQRTVWRRTRKERVLGYISEFDTNSYRLGEAEADQLNVSHRRLMLGIGSALTALVLLGLLADYSAAGL